MFPLENQRWFLVPNLTPTSEEGFARQTVVLGKCQGYLNNPLNFPVRAEKVKRIHTSNHRDRVTDLQHGLQHKVRHETMYPLQTCKGLRSIIGRNILMKDR